MIIIDNLTKEYKKNNVVAIKNVSYKFEDGKFYAIMGRSGSGKSTLLQILGLLDVPTTGSLTIDKKDVLNLSEKEKTKIRLNKIGFVFQDNYLNNNLNVYENLMLPLIVNNKLSIAGKNAIINQLLNKMDISNRSRHFPKQLSGGEKQRVSIARALINDPDIIIADEPTGNLDKENELKIFSILKELSKEGKCVIIVSHSERVKEFADVILTMQTRSLRSDIDD